MKLIKKIALIIVLASSANFVYADGGAAPTGGNPFSSLVMFGLVFVVLWWFMIRPQNKKRKELAAYRENIQKGDKIVTIGGIHGKVAEIKEGSIIITTEGGGKLEVEKSAVSMDASTQMTTETAKQAS